MAAKTVHKSLKFEIGSARSVELLFEAASTIKVRLIRLLIEGGIDVNIRNSQDQTPLLAASVSVEKSRFPGETKEEVVKYLIKAGANVNVQDKTGRTPLIYAIITQAHESVIFDLVKAGADLWLEDNNQNCAFDYALQRGDLTQVDMLVEAYKKCRLCSRKETDEPRRKLLGTFGRKKRPLRHRTTKDSGGKELATDKGDQKQDSTPRTASPLTNKVSPEKTTTKAQRSPKTKRPPKRPLVFPSVSDEKQLCHLCKSVIVGEALPSVAKDANLAVHDLTSLFQRRKSTGSAYGLTEERGESIRRKKKFGITLEELFSCKEINQPTSKGKSVLEKCSRTNTMVDVASEGLSVPDVNRSLSSCASMPAIGDASKGQRSLGEKELPTDDIPLPLGHEHLPRPSKAKPSLARPSSLGVYQKGTLLYASDSEIYLPDERDVDVHHIQLVTLSSATSAKDDSTSSQRDLTTPQDKATTPQDKATSPGGVTSIGGRSNPPGSPIPKILLTDFTTSL